MQYVQLLQNLSSPYQVLSFALIAVEVSPFSKELNSFAPFICNVFLPYITVFFVVQCVRGLSLDHQPSRKNIVHGGS